MESGAGGDLFFFNFNQVVIQVNNSLVWVNYPNNAERKFALAAIERLVNQKPELFRPFETVEFSIDELHGSFKVPVYEKERAIVPDGRSRALPFEQLVCGTHRKYHRGCRCDACRTAVREYNKRLKLQRGPSRERERMFA